MKYKLIILDIDGTVAIHPNSWRHIHEKLGLWDEFAHRYQERFLSGKISYRRFCELDAACWKGLPEKKIKDIFKQVPYARNALRCITKLRKMGFRLAAISTGLQYVAERIKRELKFDYVLSNRLLSRKGILTGKVKINVTHGAKGKAMTRILKLLHTRPHEVISVGDSSGDIPLARCSGYSIAFNSSDERFSKIVDYNCKTRDFNEVFRKIVSITGSRPIILASKSKARQDLLRQIGLRFQVSEPRIKETSSSGKSVGSMVVENALKKAKDVARRFHSGIVISADTVVTVGTKIIGKPKNIEDAVTTLKILSRKPQWVYTGIAVIDIDNKKTLTACEKTKVYMYPLTENQIRSYFKHVSPLDKSGSFDIQGLGSIFIERIEGCFYNVVGLPIARLSRLLEKLGIDIFPTI